MEFARSKEARRASEKADGAILAGRPVRCQMKVGGVMKGWRPRRLGGGFGGRKESGQMRFGGKANPFSRKGILALKADHDSTQRASSSTEQEGSGRKSNDSFVGKVDDHLSLKSNMSEDILLPSSSTDSTMKPSKMSSKDVEANSKASGKKKSEKKKYTKAKKEKKKKKHREEND